MKTNIQQGDSDRQSPLYDASLTGRLREIRHLALDLDGTVYLGDRLFEFTSGFLQSLKQMSIDYTFLTNNSSKSDRQYVDKLHAMGVEAEMDEIYSSTHATIDYLRSSFAAAQRLFVLGTQGLHDQISEAGYTVCDSEPDVVVIGYDTGLVYDRLTQAAYWIQQGKPYLATHPDLVCPTDQPLVLPDCGAFCRLLEAATGRMPDAVLGKPNVAMLGGLRQRFGLECSEMAMVGDRLYTDMAMAREAGILGILVLTGETRLEHLERASHRPDLVIEDLGKLGPMLAKARNQTISGP